MKKAPKTTYQLLAEIIRKCMERANIPEHLYSIDEYKEGAVCIQQNIGDKGGCFVYVGRLGQRGNVTVYDDYFAAFGKFVDWIFDRELQFRKAYQNAIYSQNEEERRKMRIYMEHNEKF